jgi:Skp family chaperone for outer membrane proteins
MVPPFYCLGADWSPGVRISSVYLNKSEAHLMRTTFQKRQKEIKRLEKRKTKELKRIQRKMQKTAIKESGQDGTEVETPTPHENVGEA